MVFGKGLEDESILWFFFISGETIMKIQTPSTADKEKEEEPSRKNRKDVSNLHLQVCYKIQTRVPLKNEGSDSHMTASLSSLSPSFSWALRTFRKDLPKRRRETKGKDDWTIRMITSHGIFSHFFKRDLSGEDSCGAK